MKLPFFPNGSSSLGKLCDMQIRLSNFQQQVVDGERFNLSDYISENKFTKTRLYLLSKETSHSQKIRDLSTENLLKDDDSDDLELAAVFSNFIPITIAINDRSFVFI